MTYSYTSSRHDDMFLQEHYGKAKKYSPGAGHESSTALLVVQANARG